MISFSGIDAFGVFIDRKHVEQVFSKICHDYERRSGKLLVTLIGSDEMIEMNKAALGHNYDTDILTFDYSKENKIMGELFISYPFVEQSAKTYIQKPEKELFRVIIHGILHLIGEDDKNHNSQLIMRSKEDFYLKFAGF
jgi:probable rRNA maturation factor